MTRHSPAVRMAGGVAVAQAAALGRTLVVVPHPDDETLGCGGLLALLAEAGMPVLLVLVSDGAASHPASAAYPRARLAALRLGELYEALATLGLHDPDVRALGLPDGAVPASAQDPRFGPAVERVAAAVSAFRPQTVLLPWRHDDHPDHRASHALASAACDRAAPHSRRLEYTVWQASAPVPDDRPAPAPWPIAIDTVVDRKQLALKAHRSQRGLVVDDDPGGFVLPAHLVAACALPTETYFDTTGWSER